MLSLMQLLTINFCCHIKAVATQIKMANERKLHHHPKLCNPGELYPSFRGAGRHYVVQTRVTAVSSAAPPAAQVPPWLRLAGSLQVC